MRQSQKLVLELFDMFQEIVPMWVVNVSCCNTLHHHCFLPSVELTCCSMTVLSMACQTKFACKTLLVLLFCLRAFFFVSYESFIHNTPQPMAMQSYQASTQLPICKKKKQWFIRHLPKCYCRTQKTYPNADPFCPSVLKHLSTRCQSNRSRHSYHASLHTS